MSEGTAIGRVVRVSVSDGGVPKHSVGRARIAREGVSGDRQNDLEHHGGPERAVCVFSMEVIERLRGEGHPIEPGSVGENLTVEGLDWACVAPGVRLELEGGALLEVASYASPCRTIAGSFADGESKRISQKLHPNESRVYCRVVRESDVIEGEAIRVVGGSK
jgi:MOSC domain-containing protein YiiM